MNIIKNRYLYFLISLLVIVPGIIFMAMHWISTKEGPLSLGIDFRGGSLLEVQFAGKLPSIADIQTIYGQFQSTTGQSLSDMLIQPLGTDSYSITSKQIDDATKGKIVAALEAKTGSTVTVQNFTSVSASMEGLATRMSPIASRRNSPMPVD